MIFDDHWAHLELGILDWAFVDWQILPLQRDIHIEVLLVLLEGHASRADRLGLVKSEAMITIGHVRIAVAAEFFVDVSFALVVRLVVKCCINK